MHNLIYKYIPPNTSGHCELKSWFGGNADLFALLFIVLFWLVCQIKTAN